MSSPFLGVYCTMGNTLPQHQCRTQLLNFAACLTQTETTLDLRHLAVQRTKSLLNSWHSYQHRRLSEALALFVAAALILFLALPLFAALPLFVTPHSFEALPMFVTLQSFVDHLLFVARPLFVFLSLSVAEGSPQLSSW